MGKWGVRTGRATDRICNGQDDNCDGLVDNYDVVVTGYKLRDPGQFSPGCRSDEPLRRYVFKAFMPGDSGCATTGFGPIGLEDDTITVACVADTAFSHGFARLGAVTGETCLPQTNMTLPDAPGPMTGIVWLKDTHRDLVQYK